MQLAEHEIKKQKDEEQRLIAQKAQPLIEERVKIEAKITKLKTDIDGFTNNKVTGISAALKANREKAQAEQDVKTQESELKKLDKRPQEIEEKLVKQRTAISKSEEELIRLKNDLSKWEREQLPDTTNLKAKVEALTAKIEQAQDTLRKAKSELSNAESKAFQIYRDGEAQAARIRESALSEGNRVLDQDVTNWKEKTVQLLRQAT